MHAETGVQPQRNRYLVFKFPSGSQCSQIIQPLQEGMIMRDSEDQSRLAQINVAVVEVRQGESQKEAWRRYKADHPEGVGASVRIFHYPSQGSENQKEKVTQSQMKRKKL